jgi:hypothetical protein
VQSGASRKCTASADRHGLLPGETSSFNADIG